MATKEKKKCEISLRAEIKNLDDLKSLIEQTKNDVSVLENDLTRINSFKPDITISTAVV
jgi:hypothetical protein